MGNANGKSKQQGGAKKAPAKQLSFKEKYKMGKELGSGAFATVRQGTSTVPVEGTDSTEFAIKCIQKESLTPEDEIGLVQEIDIMEKLNHPHIVRLYEHFDEDKEVFLVTELMPGGELFERIVEKSRYTEFEARECVKAILQALDHLHKKHIVHRDLKPENLLLASKTDDNDVKIADFGFAKHASALDDDHSLETQCGTPGYIAPEILKGKPYGTKADVWSFGVIVYILLGGYPPFYDENQRNLFKKIKNGVYHFHPKYWDSISEEAKDLIRQMLVVDPDQRQSCEQLLHHSWITQGDDTLSSRDISSSLAELKKWNAKRKFKGAAQAVIAGLRFRDAFNLPTAGGGHEGAGGASATASAAAAEETETRPPAKA